MACNETGNGALADVNDIVHAVKEALLTTLETKRAQRAVAGGDADDRDDGTVVHGLKDTYQQTTRYRKVRHMIPIILRTFPLLFIKSFTC